MTEIFFFVLLYHCFSLKNFVNLRLSQNRIAKVKIL